MMSARLVFEKTVQVVERFEAVIGGRFCTPPELVTTYGPFIGVRSFEHVPRDGLESRLGTGFDLDVRKQRRHDCPPSANLRQEAERPVTRADQRGPARTLKTSPMAWSASSGWRNDRLKSME